MTVTKAHIVERASGETVTTKTLAGRIVDEVFETIKETLARGESVKVVKFGVFSTRDKKERIGRDINTGEPIRISARRVVRFKASRILLAAINRE